MPSHAEQVLGGMAQAVLHRISSGSSLVCPVDMAAAFLRLCHAQSCGKCVPCRVGVGQLLDMMEDVLTGKGTMQTLQLMRKTARNIAASADCAIGFEAAKMVLRGLDGFEDDYIAHVTNGRCSVRCEQAVPCMSRCPAGVEIPGYIALVGEKRYGDAIRLIRKDNPFPTVCGYVCEHPCEARCRRNIMDDAINIRSIKRFAADQAGYIPPEPCAPATGKSVAIIGAGPAGLTAAYYLSIMGHSVTVYEKRSKLGGMLVYGIPDYRLPQEKLNLDIDAILATGVNVVQNVEIGKDIMLRQLLEQHDAVYIAIGAHADKKLDVPGAKGEGVMAAIELLGRLGEGERPDLSGKQVVVVGGGNVAMDAARSAVRLGAAQVSIVYRRRRDDMTALPEEVDGAVAEGCELVTHMAPAEVERDAQGRIVAFWGQPQISGRMDKSGRPAPVDASVPKVRIPCDLVIVAIGQSIVTDHFRFSGIQVNRGAIAAKLSAEVPEHYGIFAGGDCVTGPATVIQAIAAGKVAAANIDEYLGFHHEISTDVEIPEAHMHNTPAWGRANETLRPACLRVKDFDIIEYAYTEDAATTECSRCLRCDHFGCGPYWEDRRRKW